MLKPFKVILFMAACLLLAGCATAPTPTATAVPSATSLPPTVTQTIAPTDTVVPDAGVSASGTPDIFTELNPVSTPAKEWNGIPIMPDALAGDGGETSYYFTTKSTADAIHTYYDQALPNAGYAPLAVGNGQGNTVVLFYQGTGQNSAASLSISLFTKGDVILVMIVKS
jgi:hypothetical protein